MEDFITKSEIITKATKESYIYSIKRVEKYTNKSIEDALNAPETTFKTLEDAISNRASLKTTIAALLGLMKHSGLKTKNKKLFERWYKLYMPLLKEASDDRLNNRASDRQLKSNIRWEQVLDKFKHLLNTDPGGRDTLLLGFYVILKPRRQEDYFQIYIYPKSLKTVTKPEEFKARPAYIDFRTNTIVINQFKTAKSMPPFKKTIPDELLGLLAISLKLKPRRYVFTQSDGSLFKTPNSFTQYSNRIFKKILGPHVTVNTLRHAYSSYRNSLSLTLKERKNDSYDMGHTLETHLSYAVDPRRDAALPSSKSSIMSDSKHDSKPIQNPPPKSHKSSDSFIIEQNNNQYNCISDKLPNKSKVAFTIKKNNKNYSCISTK